MIKIFYFNYHKFRLSESKFSIIFRLNMLKVKWFLCKFVCKRIFTLFWIFIELNATSLEEKLIGGESLLFGSMLFVVSIHKNGEHKCAGSLISQNHVLTVAQCLIHIIKGGLWSNIHKYKVTVARFGKTDVLFDVTDLDIHKNADIGLLLVSSCTRKINLNVFQSDRFHQQKYLLVISRSSKLFPGH